MKNRIFTILTFLLGAIAAASITGCQSPAGANPILAVELTATPAVLVETRPPTPARAPAPQPQVDAANPHTPFPYKSIVDFGETESGKLSGIVYYPPRQTLFAVSDNGRIVEINTDGAVVQNKEIRKKADFEGITYSPATEMLYVAIEGQEVILEINPETLEAERDIPIDRMFEGDILLSPEGNGIEGITFVPAGDGAANGSFYLVNQSDELGGADPSIVFEVEIDYAAGESPARIIRYFSVGVTDLSGIHYNPSSRRLLVISDANNLLLEVSLAGQLLAISLLPGEKQEGITIDAAGLLYIAQDKKDALLKLTPLDNNNDPDNSSQ